MKIKKTVKKGKEKIVRKDKDNFSIFFVTFLFLPFSLHLHLHHHLFPCLFGHSLLTLSTFILMYLSTDLITFDLIISNVKVTCKSLVHFFNSTFKMFHWNIKTQAHVLIFVSIAVETIGFNYIFSLIAIHFQQLQKLTSTNDY